MRRHPEDDLQRALVHYLRAACPEAISFSVPNGGFRSGHEASRMQGTGTLAGVPDLCVLWAKGQCGFLEVKVRRGGHELDVSPAQKRMIVRLDVVGIRFALVTSLDDVRQVVRNWQIPCRDKLL